MLIETTENASNGHRMEQATRAVVQRFQDTARTSFMLSV